MSPTICITLEDGPRHVPAGSSLADLLLALGHEEKAVSTAVQGQFVPRSQRTATLLQAGDVVLIFQAIVGG
jgi:sulfur carrier protein